MNQPLYRFPRVNRSRGHFLLSQQIKWQQHNLEPDQARQQSEQIKANYLCTIPNTVNAGEIVYNFIRYPWERASALRVQPRANN